MFIRSTDLQCVSDKLTDGVLVHKLASLLRGISYTKRLTAHWDAKIEQTKTPRRRLFAELPAVRQRIAQQYEGKDVTHWIFDRWLAGRQHLRAVSIGCGAANAELIIASMGKASNVFERITCFDPSQASLEVARSKVRTAALENLFEFKTGAIEDLNFSPQSFDVAFAFSSLHHLKDVPAKIDKVRSWLKPAGVLIAHEYVGPSRQQYDRVKVDLIKSLFAALPDRFRLDWKTGQPRTKVPIPGAALMWLYDPSEMVESARIIPALESSFRIVELRPEHGTLLLCLLKEIAHNFNDDDSEAQTVLHALCDIEQSLVDAGIIDPDFATVVCERRE